LCFIGIEDEQSPRSTPDLFRDLVPHVKLGVCYFFPELDIGEKLHFKFDKLGFPLFHYIVRSFLGRGVTRKIVKHGAFAKFFLNFDYRKYSWLEEDVRNLNE
jgi:hypothetical protein